MSQKIRIGVVGLQWGATLAQHCQEAGMQVSALCDTNGEKLQRACERFGAAGFHDFDTFLAEGEMDAVILANDFDEHAPLAIRALDAGKHVLSETAACRSIAEGIDLIRAVERSGRMYMFAANYPYKPHVRAMHDLFAGGELGVFQYGECEYLHSWSPPEFAYFIAMPNYWRARISSLAYCTHSLLPVMYVTDTLPTEVSAFVIPTDASADAKQAANLGRGLAGIMVIQMDNGTYLKSLHGFLQGDQEPDAFWLRIHGSHGLAESLRQGDSRTFRLHKEKWASGTGATKDVTHVPEDTRSEDLLICQEFAQSILTGVPSYFDVYRGVAASIVGVCAMRSLLNGSVPISIPDLRQESDRLRYQDDYWDGLEGRPETATVGL